jgi:hypothetical protein
MSHTECYVQEINRAGKVSQVLIEDPTQGTTVLTTDSLLLAESTIVERVRLNTGYKYRLVVTTFGEWLGGK